MKKPATSRDKSEGVEMSDDLRESLELLIERDNPMANAAENALEQL